MPYKDKAKEREWYRAYCKRNRGKINARQRERMKKLKETNPEEYARQVSSWAKSNPERRKRVAKERYLKRKPEVQLEVFRHYSKSLLPFCACCGENDFGFLTLDHINNDGAEWRRQNKSARSGFALYSWLKRNGFPGGLQVLCWNCNSARGALSKCPHDTQFQILLEGLGFSKLKEAA